MIAALCTDTVRLRLGSYQKLPPSEWMLPSNASPTTCASRLITGLPELPPMMSLVLTKLNGVSWAIRPCASSQRVGNA